jgi:putative oxidoreductase
MSRVYNSGSNFEYHLATLLLRLMVGGMMLFHGIDKALHGVSFIEHLLAQQGLPTFLVYGIYVGEIVAPVMLIIGYEVKLFALIIALNMLIAIYLVHMKQLFTLGAHGAWALEVQAFYLISSLVIVLLGAGRYRLGKS